MIRPIMIEITPLPEARILPLELLEDFADMTRGWSFLEDDSRHYTGERGQQASILRHRRTGDFPEADFVFTAQSNDPHSSVFLKLVHPTQSTDPFSAQVGGRLITQFLNDFRAYLDMYGAAVELRTTERVIQHESVIA